MFSICVPLQFGNQGSWVLANELSLVILTILGHHSPEQMQENAVAKQLLNAQMFIKGFLNQLV